VKLIYLLNQQSWIWIICLLCIIIRVVLDCNGSYEFKFQMKKTLKKIGFLFFLIVLWGSVNSNEENEKLILGLFIITYFYIFYLLAERCSDTGGYTSSILLIINCMFITILSFTNEITAIIGAICIIGISIFVFKHWTEKKSDLAENIALCIETIIVSLFLMSGSFDSIYYTLLYLFMSESLLAVINKAIRYIVKEYYREKDEF